MTSAVEERQEIALGMQYSSSGLPQVRVGPNGVKNAALTNDTSDLTLRGHASIAENFDTFLKIMVAQMQHQDPMNPMDTKDMTQQIIGFASVEQSLNTNKKLDALVRLSEHNSIKDAQDFVGSEVEAYSDLLHFTPEKGHAEFSYMLPEGVDKASVVISNAEGRPVRIIKLETLAPGKYDCSWDGTDNMNNALAEGAYQVKVLAQSSAEDGKYEKELKVPTSMKTKVKGFEQDQTGAVFLSDGKVSFPLKNVFAGNDKPQFMGAPAKETANTLADDIKNRADKSIDELIAFD